LTGFRSQRRKKQRTWPETPVSRRFDFSKPVSHGLIRENAFESGYREPETRVRRALARQFISLSTGAWRCGRLNGVPRFAARKQPVEVLLSSSSTSSEPGSWALPRD